ncbi:MAG: hypothetical protein MUD01_12650 [Chloroflexaceae bacterium]|jgi:hypothetical protein|nr:hypothetical protein [Chloroflexaceae bacterium]
MLTEQQRETTRQVGTRVRAFGRWLSAFNGGVVGIAFGFGSRQAWNYTLGGFLLLLIVGMVAVLCAVYSEKVRLGDWRAGLYESGKIFLSQTTLYATMIFGLAALVLLSTTDAVWLHLPTLAMQMMPGLYLLTALATIFSAPLYLRWMPLPEDRR